MSTIRRSDDDASVDGNERPCPPRDCPPYSTSSDDESGVEGDDETENEHAEVVLIPQDQAVWTPEELHVLSPYKDQWLQSGRDQQGAIVEAAVTELRSLRKQDPGPLRQKVRTWLRRKVKRRRMYGPGKPPALHSVVAWYRDVELHNLLKEKHGVVPGDKARFIGLWKKELTALVNDLKNNPMKKMELKRMEDKQQQWMAQGPPPSRRKW
jgi:hypothetical protein